MTIYRIRTAQEGTIAQARSIVTARKGAYMVCARTADDAEVYDENGSLVGRARPLYDGEEIVYDTFRNGRNISTQHLFPSGRLGARVRR